jgi:hypothetical protein
MEYGLQGVVHTVEWTCRITRWGTDDNDFVATSGKTTLQPIDPNVEHFVQYHDVSEEMALEWVRDEMMEKWGETENNIVTAWMNSRWVIGTKTEDGLPWRGGVLSSTEEEEEPSWVKAAMGVKELGVKKTDTTFEPLSMPEDNAVHSERNAEEENETTDGDSGNSETDEEESPNPSGYSPMFGTNAPTEEE